MWDFDRVIQIVTGIGVLGALGFAYRLYQLLKANYASKEEILREKAQLTESALTHQIEATKEFHKTELEKRELEIRKLQDENEQLKHLVDKRMIDLNVALKYYLAYDLKDIKPEERNMLHRYVDELEGIVATGKPPQDALPLLVQVHLKFGNEDEAIYYQRKTVELDPHDCKRLKELSHVYHVFGQYESAIETAEKILKINESDDRALYEIAVCNQMIASSKPTGSSDQALYDKRALNHYQKCLEIDPEYITAEIMKALVLHRLGDVSASSDIVKRIQRKVDNGELVHREFYAYACLLAQMNSTHKAIEILKMSIAVADSKNKILLLNNIARDPDLNPIRKSAEFTEFTKHIDKISREHIG